MNKIISDQRAQISVEYLILIVFGMMLVITTGIIVININTLIAVAKSKILAYRDNIISSL
ncbi:MAG: hypothetical protein PHU47_02845 [Candidatus ainarchaeum sp.]|jgi:uncharacterized protein (UPF0333 family)|nr:hypothetical protein [Candidatus ainarchaeum sp.]